MNVKRLISVALAVLVISFVAPAYVNAQPPALPHTFYGTLKFDVGGTIVDAPVDTVVKAEVEGVIGTPDNPIVTSVPGRYGGPDWADQKLAVQGNITPGDTITFWVQRPTDAAPHQADQTANWQSMAIEELNLTVTIAGPSPPPGGGGGGPAPRDTTPPRISNVLLCHEGITETTADICWTTHEKSTSQVEYWTSPSMLSPLDETLVINHHVELTGLTPGTKYYYKTMSMDRRDNLAVSDEYTFTTLGKPPAAAFTSSDLSISPTEVDIGEEVTISVLVTNTGDLAGSYEVTLKIDHLVVASDEVTLAAGASEKVTFTAAKDVAGSYSVAINGLAGSFTVKAPIAPAPPPVAPAPPAPPVAPPPTAPTGVNWAVVGPIIAVAVFLSIFLPLRQRRRRAG